MSKSLNFWEAVATLVGTIIGAGILGIPFAVHKVGFGAGLIFLFVLGIAVMFVHLMVGEMMLRNKEDHQIAGCVKKYVGHGWQYLEYLAIFIGNYGALLAYIIAIGAVLSAMWGGDAEWHSIIFWLAGSIVLYFGLKWVKVIELIMVIGVFSVVLIISGAGASSLSQITWFENIGFHNTFLLYGVILFAYAGTGAIFSVKKILNEERRLIKKAIVYAGLIAMVVYVLFTATVLAICGGNVTEVATVGLGSALGRWAIIVGNLFAFFTLSTSFLSVGLGLKQIFEYDLKINHRVAWLLVVFVPFLLFLSGIRDFITILGVVGAFSFGASGILIVTAYRRAKKLGDQRPVFALSRSALMEILLLIMFSAGIVYAIWDMVR
ncbi:MAG: aromatic amino acid transport family protein [Candidatus Falkowbacteria bacterium]